MNNSELEKKLKAAPGPALATDYLETFPQTVLAKLRSAPKPAMQARHSWRPRLAWGFAMGVCIVIAFAAGHWHGHTAVDKDVMADAKLIQETLAMFPNRVRAIVRDEKGMNLILADSADVPVSTPIYLHICDGKQCSSVVTFSGQEIQVAGQKLTVLSEGDGGIILEGDRFAWSNRDHAPAGTRLKIEARNLGTVAM